MNNSDKVVGFSIDPNNLIGMLKSLKGKDADRLRKISAESIEGMMKSISGVRYDIKVECKPHWVTAPANAMDKMIQDRHREEVASAIEPLLVKALNELVKKLDMDALEMYYDLLQKLEGGEA